MSNIKTHLYEHCRTVATERIALLESQIEEIRASRHLETKSSAGDKYETSRAMLQLEEDKYASQLVVARSVLHELKQIDIGSKSVIEPGALVETSSGHFFISIGSGKVIIDGIKYYCISADAPIAIALNGATAGDLIEFRNTQVAIRHIE